MLRRHRAAPVPQRSAHALQDDAPHPEVPPTGRDIRIGSGCFIGTNATILGGVTIGDNVIVGSGAVVTTDVPQGTFVAGVPAKNRRSLTGANVPLFKDKLDHTLAVFDVEREADLARSRGETPCFVSDPGFFGKVGMGVDVGVAFAGTLTLTVDSAIVALEALLHEGNRPFVLYAVEQTDDGLPLVSWLTRHEVKYRGVGGYRVGGYVYDDRVTRETLENAFLEQAVAGYEKFSDPGSHQDFVNLTQALNTTRKLSGDVVEVGCFRGSSGSVMLDYARNKGLPPKHFWFFDVFEGFNYDAALESADAVWANSHETEGEKVVRDRLTAKAGDNEVTVTRLNVISDPLPPALTAISVANIDVDLYEAVVAGLSTIAPLMEIGGIMICEDAGHTPALIGAALALREFLDSDAGGRFTPVHMVSGQVFLIRHS